MPLVKEATLKSYLLYDFIYMKLWKRQNYRNSKKISGCQGLGSLRGRGGQVEPSGFLGQ